MKTIDCIFVIEAGGNSKLKQVSLMVLCMESEVGCLAQTGKYKHYLSHTIPLFLHYGILIGAPLVFHFLEQITTHSL